MWLIIKAEMRKVTALRMKTRSRLMKVATSPPSAEPMAMVAAVVEAESAFAVKSASGDGTMFGIAARFAALKKAESVKRLAPVR